MPYIASGRGEFADFYLVCTNIIEVYKMIFVHTKFFKKLILLSGLIVVI